MKYAAASPRQSRGSGAAAGGQRVTFANSRPSGEQPPEAVQKSRVERAVSPERPSSASRDPQTGRGVQGVSESESRGAASTANLADAQSQRDRAGGGTSKEPSANESLPSPNVLTASPHGSDDTTRLESDHGENRQALEQQRELCDAIDEVDTRLDAFDRSLHEATLRGEAVDALVQRVSALVDACDERHRVWDERLMEMLETDTRRSADVARKQEELALAFGLGPGATSSPLVWTIVGRVFFLISVAISVIVFTPVSAVRRWYDRRRSRRMRNASQMDVLLASSPPSAQSSSLAHHPVSDSSGSAVRLRSRERTSVPKHDQTSTSRSTRMDAMSGTGDDAPPAAGESATRATLAAFTGIAATQISSLPEVSRDRTREWRDAISEDASALARARPDNGGADTSRTSMDRSTPGRAAAAAAAQAAPAEDEREAYRRTRHSTLQQVWSSDASDDTSQLGSPQSQPSHSWLDFRRSHRRPHRPDDDGTPLPVGVDRDADASDGALYTEGDASKVRETEDAPADAASGQTGRRTSWSLSSDSPNHQQFCHETSGDFWGSFEPR